VVPSQPPLWLISPSTRRPVWYLVLNTTVCSRAWPVFAQHWFTQTECLSAGHREFTSAVKLTKSGTSSLQMPGPRPSHWAGLMSHLGKRHTKKVPARNCPATEEPVNFLALLIQFSLNRTLEPVLTSWKTCIRREYILARSVEMLAFVVNQDWFRSPT
jgi:hypothetical protein